MAEFTVAVEGRQYDVTAPDEKTAWQWANHAHRQATSTQSQEPSQSAPIEKTAEEQIGERFTNVNENIGKNAYKLGGWLTDLGAKAGLPPEVSGGIGYVGNVAAQAIPSVLGGQAFGKAASPAFEATGKRLMQSALKPSVGDMLAGKGDRAIKTMLDEGANVSRGGITKLQGKSDELGKQVEALITPSTKTVNKYEVARELRDVGKKFTNQVNPVSDRAAVSSVADEFLNQHPLVGQSSDIPVQLAQKIKQGTYKILGDKSYGGELTNAATDAQKALARGLRKGIEKAVPEVAAPNAMQSELINALKVASRRNAVAGNKNPAGLALLPHSPMAAAAFLADRSELIKSLLARTLYSGRELIPATAAGGAIAGSLDQGQQ